MLARRALIVSLSALVCAVGWLAKDAFAARHRAVAMSSGLSRISMPVVVPPLEPPAPIAPARVTVALTGDVAVALGVAVIVKQGHDPSFPFGDVADRLRKYDLLVGNLECVVATHGVAVIPEPLVAPVQTPKLLVDAGFDLVSIANNHTLDMSDRGYFEMLRRLDAAGLSHFGSTTADHARDPIAVREVGGVRVAFIGQMDRDEKRAIADVARARQRADVVIAFEHWGVEYVQHPARYQRLRGRALIDAGADAVIGAHAHVVQPMEMYRDRRIVYGLGNFVFSGMVRPGTHTGAVLELDLDTRGIAAHRFRRVSIDELGAPHFSGEPTDEPPLDPPSPRPLAPL